MDDGKKPRRFNPDLESPASVDDNLLSALEDGINGEARIETIKRPANKPQATQKEADQPGFSNGDLSSLGRDLAVAMQDEGYHPVVLFGTNNSGKTSILMSLFSTLSVEPQLETGLRLCDAILGSRTEVARQLHREAEHTFEIKTEAFLAGEKIPKTSTSLPFFIPVEFRPPDGRPAVKFAFLESNGEWYRPLISDGSKLSEIEKLYPDLRGELESFITAFQNGITFIYTAPVTQGEVYAPADKTYDTEELQYASLAIRGVLKTYDAIRANARAEDKHLMLVTKWDALSARDADRASGIEEDREALLEFCHKRYNQALSAFQGLNLKNEQKKINAYCAGMITKTGLIGVATEDSVSRVIASYPVRLWDYLYRNALEASGQQPISAFREPELPNGFRRAASKFLDWMSG